jgi:hypothetical protein
VTALDPAALESVLAMAGGDRSFVLEVIDEYLEDSARQLAALNEADGEDRRRAAHTLKSTSASVGAARLAELCGQIERAGDDVEEQLIADAAREHAAVAAGLRERRARFQ